VQWFLLHAPVPLKAFTLDLNFFPDFDASNILFEDYFPPPCFPVLNSNLRLFPVQTPKSSYWIPSPICSLLASFPCFKRFPTPFPFCHEDFELSWYSCEFRFSSKASAPSTSHEKRDTSTPCFEPEAILQKPDPFRRSFPDPSLCLLDLPFARVRGRGSPFPPLSLLSGGTFPCIF